MSKQPCKPRACSPPPSQVEQNLDQDQNELVRLIAWRIYSRVPRHASLEINDVIQAGHLGLLRARRSYRSECDVPFSIYARYRIRGEILDMLRRLDTAPRSLRRWHRIVENQTRELTIRLHRLPTDEELSDALGIELNRIRHYRQLLASVNRDRESPQRTGDEAHPCARESAADSGWMPDVIQERKESFQLLLRSIDSLSPRARRVVLLYYRQNLTMKQIGNILQVNESRISQIHKCALQSINTVLRTCGIRSAASF